MNIAKEMLDELANIEIERQEKHKKYSAEEKETGIELIKILPPECHIFKGIEKLAKEAKADIKIELYMSEISCKFFYYKGVKFFQLGEGLEKWH